MAQTFGYTKAHKQNEFAVKSIKRRGVIYWLVIDTYDQSQASIEATESDAIDMASKLNEMRNKRTRV